MKRTIKSLVMAFGPAAVLPLVMACSRPAQTPTGAPTAPNEPGAPTQQQVPGAGTEVPGQAPTPGPTGQLGTQEQMGPGAMGQGQMGQQPGAMGQQQGQMQPGMQGQQPGQQGLGSGIGQGQQAQPGEGQQGATTGINERALCESLATEGRMRVEDAQNGVAIVITPKAGNQLATLRDDARRLESAIRSSSAGGEGVVGAPQRNVRSGEACGLAELGRLPGVSTQLVESGNSVRILMTTNNANEVRDLRRIARDEVNALSKAGGAGPGRQRGGMGGGQRGGGQQQQPGQQR